MLRKVLGNSAKCVVQSVILVINGCCSKCNFMEINVKINHNRFPFFVFVCICADNNCHSRRKIRILQNRNHTTMATTIKKDIYMTSLGEVAYFTICDDECGSVVLSALGAGVVALSVPDGNGEYRDGYRA